LPPPKEGTVSKRTRKSAASAYRAGQSGDHDVSQARSRATRKALKHEGHSAASSTALSRQAHAARLETRIRTGRRGPQSGQNERRDGSLGRRQEGRTNTRTQGNVAAQSSG
jgi:hypothetical protein